MLLDDDVSGQYTISEPIVTAGLLDFGAGKKALETNWEYWYSEWYGYCGWYGVEKPRNEYPVISMGPKDGWKKKWMAAGARDIPFQAFKCFAVPLASVKSDSDVETKIGKPLLALA